MAILFDTIAKSNTDDFKNYPAVEAFEMDLDDSLIGLDAIAAEGAYNESIIDSMRAVYESLKADNDVEIVVEGVVDNAKAIISWFQQWLSNFKDSIVKYFKKIYQKVAKFKFKASKVASAGFVPVKQFTVKGYDFTFDYGNHRTPEIINDVLYKTNLAIASIDKHEENLEVIVNRFCNELGNTQISVYRGMLCGQDFLDAEYYDDALFEHFHAGASKGDKKDILITTPALRNYVKQVKVLQNVIKNCETDRDHMKDDIQRIITNIKSQASRISVTTDDPMNDNRFANDKVNRAKVSIFAHANNILKRAHFICARYYYAKLQALDEAIQFYDYVLGRAQGKLDVPLSEGTNYSKLEDDAFYRINEAFNAELVDSAISELYLMANAWEAKELVVEAEAVQVGINKAPITRRRVTGIFGNIKEVIRKIIAFISNALNRFNQAVADLLKTDIQWVVDNNAMLSNIPQQVLNTMTLQYTNYMHTNAHQRIAERRLPTNGTLRSIATRIGNEAVKAKQAGRQLDGAMTCYKNFFPQLYKIDPNNWKNAAILYYRGGQNGSYLPPQRQVPGRGETVMARGKECQEVVKVMLTYCLNYKQYANACTQTLNQLKAAMNEQNNVIDQLSRERGAMTNEADISNATFGGDMYSILENCDLISSDLRYNIKILTEGGLDYIREELGSGAASPQHPLYMTGARPSQYQAQQQQAQAQQQQPQQQAQPKPMEPKNPQQQQDPQQQQRAQQASYATDASKQLIAAYQVCSSICTAKLTVCEEIERSYMRVLRGVAASIQKYNGDNDTDRANRQYNKERQEDKQAAQDERLQRIRYRNQQKKARNTGLIGGMKNILGV